MRICVQCLYTESWKEIAKIVVPNIVNYCRRHDYLWNIQCIAEPYDAFEKIKQIKKIFEVDESDVVMSMDCDAIFTQYNRKIEDVLDDQHSFWITQDVNGINGGVFIAKNDEFANRFLDYLLSFKGIALCEQDAISMYVLDYPEDTQIAVVKQELMNSYRYNLYPEHQDMIGKDGDWKQSDWILHLPGIGMTERLNIRKHTPVIL